jgi:hypothetical protein
MNLARICCACCLFVLSLGTSACSNLNARAAEAPRVPFASLTARHDLASLIGTKPVVLVFEPGERVPVRFELESMLMRTDREPVTFELVAKRRFFLLLLPDGPPKISQDGVDFEAQPKNSFKFGFAVTRSKAELVLGIGIRREALP